ncbi:MAG: MFS transporter, partial [Anaerolineae bacterium]|nr:MFS transporter [Anaerolineae bacterium]
RTGGRWLGSGGVAWTGSLLILALVIAQQTGQFWMMAVPFAVMAFGSGAFHPVGAMYASDSEPQRAARNTSIFFFMGQFGLAIGPALAGLLLSTTLTHQNETFSGIFSTGAAEQLVERGSINPVLLVGFAIIPAALFMVLSIPSRQLYLQNRHKAKSAGAAKPKTIAIKAILLLALLVTLRSLAQPGSVAFIPVLFQQKGWNAAQYGLITSSFWLAAGLSGIYVGSLADRFQRRYVMATTLILSAPAFFLLPTAGGALAFVFAILAGGLSGSTHSLIVVLGQEMLPFGKAMASGISLGFIFATGAMGSLVMGSVSDAFGLETTFQVVAAAVAVSGILALGLPAGRRVAQVIMPQPEPAVSGVR